MIAAVLAALLAACGFAADGGPVAPESPYLKTRAPLRRLGCPKGARPVEGPGGSRCVMSDSETEARDAGPALARPGAASQRVLALEAPPARAASDLRPPKDFITLRRTGISLLVPKAWHVTDAWKDDVPTLYVETGKDRPGKPVTLVVSLIAPEQVGYLSLKAAVAQEKDFQKAVERKGPRLSGLATRELRVEQESRTVYVDVGRGSYYLLNYSAPPDLYAAFEPAFDKLLESARLEPVE